MDLYIDMISSSGGPGNTVKYPTEWDKDIKFVTALIKWKQDCINKSGIPVFEQVGSDNEYVCSTKKSGSEEDVIRYYIETSKGTIHVGETISVKKQKYSDSASIRDKVSEWQKACERVRAPKSDNIDSAFSVADTNGDYYVYICKVRLCKNGYNPGPNALSCISVWGGSGTTSGGSSNSGSSGRGSSNSDGVYVGEDASAIRAKAKNVSIGAKITFDTYRFNKSQDLQYAIKDWSKACAEMSHTSPVTETRSEVVETSIKNAVVYECHITNCANGYKPASTGTSCVKNGSSGTTSGSSSSGGSSGGGSGSGTLVTGSVDHATVVQSSGQEVDVKKTISDQIGSMSVGLSFVYVGAQMKSINALMNQWNRACETLSRKPDRTDTTGFQNTYEGNKIRHTCVIKTCRGKGYVPSSDGLSCVLGESGNGATSPASKTLTGTTASKATLNDVNQMVNGQINKSSGSASSGNVSTGERGIGAIITEINTSTKNVEPGAGFSYPEKMVSVGGMELQTAITNWIARCMEYPKNHEEAVIKEMEHKKTTEKGVVHHLCAIKKCNSDYYVIAADGKSCEREKPMDISNLPKSRSASDAFKPATIEHLPNREITKVADNINLYINNIEDMAAQMYIGAWITFTKDDLKNDKLSAAVNKWEAKCNSYPEDTNDLTVNVTYVKKNKENKINNWYCLIKSCNDDDAGLPQKPSDDGQSCISTDGTSCKAGDRHAEKTHYDARNSKCIIDSCKENFTLTPEGKCEKTEKLERKAAKAKSNLEKDFVSDIEKLSDAFENVVKKLTKECEKTGGKINNGVCEGATAPATKATTNKRGSGKK